MWIKGLLLLVLGFVIAFPGWWKVSQVVPVTSFQMQREGYWRAVDATTVPKFVARCTVTNSRCRTVLAERLTLRLGYYLYFLGAGLAVGLVGLVFVLPTKKKLYSATFAKLKDVKAFIRGDDTYFIPLAKLSGKTLGLKHNPKKRRQLKHLEIIAPTQSGKSVHIKSILADYAGSGVLVDIKGELLRDTGNHRKDIGDVFVLNPRTCVHHYNPFADIGTDTPGLRAVADLLVMDPSERDPVFANRAIPAIVAALRAAQLLERPPLSYIDELVAGGAVNFIQQLSEVDDYIVRRNLINYLGTTPEEFDFEMLNDARGFLSSSWNTMLGRLQPFFEPAILEMMKSSDFSAKQIAQSTTTVYLSWPEELLRSNSRPMSLIMHGLITGMCRAFDRGDMPKVPTAFLLDEATQYRIPALPTYITTMLGRWMCAIICVQDEAQLSMSYPKAAPIITSNCKAKMYIAPSGETAKKLSEALGFVSEKTVSRQVGRGRTVSHFKRELMTPDELNLLGADEVILRIDGHHMVRGKRIEWFKEPKLKQRLAGPPLEIPGVTIFTETVATT